MWSSVQDHAVLGLLLNIVGFFISTWQKYFKRNFFVTQLYQLRRGISEVPALEYFYMIHRGGRFHVRLKNAFPGGILTIASQPSHRPRSQSPLHFDFQNIYQICMRKLDATRPTALCRVKRPSKSCLTLLPTNRFVFTTTNSMKCFANWIPMRIRVRSRNPDPTLIWISRTVGQSYWIM